MKRHARRAMRMPTNNIMRKCIIIMCYVGTDFHVMFAVVNDPIVVSMI